ncbi:hypothetical protein C1752_00641 [Acaryochloris thomasi RCC1774]|uniref:Uncharacterized protein n=1 Tax=Acaryochloris thomasi RCC1774 TaxID=1764569 RepID=A0A2W1JNV5_9CYAN|nr:hypothetical protein [Acaryochloris thomasi]PZD74916.1 hypothetical protein C1752_00641 [Acaryochloris thomasi RCC1774]
MKKVLLALLLIVPGIAGMAVFGHYALQDWDQLQQDYAEFKRVVVATSDLSTLFKANAAQTTQRINLFADGTWTLLSSLLAAIGLHGLLTVE